MRVPSAFGLGLAACTVAGTARATPPHSTARLELTRAVGAEHCMDAKRLARAVESRLHRRVFQSDPAPLLVRVELARKAGSFVAELELADVEGTLGRRTLSSSARHCSALDDSLALVVALLVDTPPARVVEVVPQSKPPASVAPSATQSGKSPAAPKPPEPVRATPLELPPDTLAPREPWQFRVRLSAIVAWGSLPAAAFGPGLAVAAKPPAGLLWRASFEHHFSRDAQVSDSAGAHFSRQRFGLELCLPDLFGSRVSADACLGQRLGRLTASGFGFDHDLEERVFTFGISGGFDVRVPIVRYFAVSLGARAELPLNRYHFSARLNDASERDVFAESALGATARVGIETDL